MQTATESNLTGLVALWLDEQGKERRGVITQHSEPFLQIVQFPLGKGATEKNVADVVIDIVWMLNEAKKEKTKAKRREFATDYIGRLLEIEGYGKVADLFRECMK